MLKQRLFNVITRTPFFFCAIALGLSACAPVPLPTEINDPREARNRKFHAVNVGVDRILLRPTANTYGAVVPDPVRSGVSNFASNLNLPGMVLNNLLQLRVEDAGTNAMRFMVNSTFGFAGLLDVASDAGIPEQSTDFGETLYVIGVAEGNYIEIPLLGPGSTRDFVGWAVDMVANPLNFVDDGPDPSVTVSASLIAGIGARYEYRDIIDSVLYESADSYSQAKLSYWDNRRFMLSDGADIEYDDPYEEIYGAE